MIYKVCIMCAGQGSRVGLSTMVNKALVPVGDLSALSHIIYKFPKDIEIVLALGYKSEQIRQFIKLAYPDRIITCVDVDRWEGPGSGPGYSLFSCKEHLDCPFIFTSCDTILLEDIPKPDHNWIGVARIEDPQSFCVAHVKDDQVVGFFDKMTVNEIKDAGTDLETIKPHGFVGMAGVYDYKAFFNAIDSHRDKLINNELQVSNGLNALIDCDLKPQSFTWFDTGTDEAYEKADAYFQTNKVLRKSNEFIYFENNRVIKFFDDANVVTQRCERASFLKGLTPEVLGPHNQFYGYDFIDGKMLSDTNDTKRFSDLLYWAKENLWKQVNLNEDESNQFKIVCQHFYQDKTKQRLAQLYATTDIIDQEVIINGVKVKPLETLLTKIDWSSLFNGVPVNFHGDFQPENIIVSDNQFVLLDWRQDFGGIIEYGDLYYDLAKLEHALLVNGEMIRQNRFAVEQNNGEITFNFDKRENLLEYQQIFHAFIVDQGWDLKKVKILGALIYLNIAPLHHHPYSLLLYFLGKSLLAQLLGEDNEL